MSLDIIPSAKYILIIDENGNTQWLERPLLNAFLMFDGTDAYWATGQQANPLVLDGLEQSHGPYTGALAIEGNGKIVRASAEGVTAKILKSLNGIVSWEDLTLIGLPATGYGIIMKQSEVDALPYWSSTPNCIPYLDANGEVVLLTHGDDGKVLEMSNGTPTWKFPDGGAVGVGISSIGLEGVLCARLDDDRVNIKAPTFTVSDGATDIALVNVNVTVDVTNANGLLGLDTGGMSANAWYYIYLISDGVDTSAIISLSAVSPDFGATGYTHWGLVSLFRYDAASAIVDYIQKGRQFWTIPVVWSNAASSTTSMALIVSATNLNTIIPPNTKSVSGNVGGNSSETAVKSMAIASNVAGIARQMVSSRENAAAFLNFEYDAGSFTDIPIIDSSAPSLAWQSSANSPLHRRIEITGYRI